jgi:hypothetical protein
MVGMTFDLEIEATKRPFKVKCAEQEDGEIDYWFEAVVRGEPK